MSDCNSQSASAGHVGCGSPLSFCDPPSSRTSGGLLALDTHEKGPAEDVLPAFISEKSTCLKSSVPHRNNQVPFSAQPSMWRLEHQTNRTGRDYKRKRNSLVTACPPYRASTQENREENSLQTLWTIQKFFPLGENTEHTKTTRYRKRFLTQNVHTGL